MTEHSQQRCAEHQNHHTLHKPSANPSAMRPAQDCDIFTHAPLTVERRAIRLLNLLPSPDPSSEIQCTLWNVDLDDRPSYKALSYVWGNPENTVQILVDGKNYNVTVNCEAALYRLRETHESSLWIDAICINQKDDDEKTSQIPLMRDIYAFADEVIVWLGNCRAEQSPDDEKRERIGFGLMEDLSICEDNIRDFPSLLEFALRAPDPISRWQLVREIYAHTWFDRLWVHQEITLASRASVLGQHHSTSWVKLSRVVLVTYDHLDTRALLLNKDPIVDLWKPIVMGIVQRDLVLRCLHYSFRHQGETIFNHAKSLLKNLEESLDLELSLFDLLKATRRFKCYNPLDRVFANLGLTKDDMGLRPHYSQTVSEVFTNVTLVAVRKQQSLKALCLAGLGMSSKTNFPEVPSWVIDWRLESEQPSSLDYDAYRAAPPLDPPLIPLFTTPSTLQVAGVQIDSLKFVLKSNEKGDDFWRNSALDIWTRDFKSYPILCDPVHAYIRTITADYDGVNPNTRSRLTEATVQKIDIVSRRAWNEYTQIFQETMPAKDGDHRNWLWGVSRIYTGFVEQRSLVTGFRGFFISKTGYMGIGPLAAEEGDVLCILPGCNTPVLIQKRNGFYVLVGECFVWGLMNGEAAVQRSHNDYELFCMQ